MKGAPLTLRLPFWLTERFSLPEVLLQSGAPSWAIAYRWLEVFDVSGPEQRFCKRLLSRKRNLWLYRCNQKAFCGDFIVVDVSAAHLPHRAVWAVELKEGASLQVDAAPGHQMARLAEALAALQAAGVVELPSPQILVGSSDAVYEYLLR